MDVSEQCLGHLDKCFNFVLLQYFFGYLHYLLKINLLMFVSPKRTGVVTIK